MSITYKTEAIILNRTNYSEADRILTALTPTYGKIRIIAKGSRKIKSRSSGHIELFGQTELMLVRGRGMEVLTSARLLWYPHTLGADYARINLAFLFGSMVDKLVEQREPHPELFRLLLDALTAINTHGSSERLELWFKLRLAQELGYRPQIDGCLVCGNTDSSTAYFISPERGGTVDASCRNAGDIELSQNAIKLWRLILQYSFNTIDAVSGAEQLATASLPACDGLYEFHLGRAFKLNMKFTT